MSGSYAASKAKVTVRCQGCLDGGFLREGEVIPGVAFDEATGPVEWSESFVARQVQASF